MSPTHAAEQPSAPPAVKWPVGAKGWMVWSGKPRRFTVATVAIGKCRFVRARGWSDPELVHADRLHRTERGAWAELCKDAEHDVRRRQAALARELARLTKLRAKAGAR